MERGIEFSSVVGDLRVRAELLVAARQCRVSCIPPIELLTVLAIGVASGTLGNELRAAFVSGRTRDRAVSTAHCTGDVATSVGRDMGSRGDTVDL
jgi:hypothetical protein